MSQKKKHANKRASWPTVHTLGEGFTTSQPQISADHHVPEEHYGLGAQLLLTWPMAPPVGHDVDTGLPPLLRMCDPAAYHITCISANLADQDDPKHSYLPGTDIASSATGPFPTDTASRYARKDHAGTYCDGEPTSTSTFKLNKPQPGPHQDESICVTLVCDYQGCAYTKPFNRKHELNRHIASKHKKAKPFSCPVRGCFKKQRCTAFPRADKLTAHMRSMHREDTPAECPHKDCTVGVLELDLLVVHLEAVHECFDEIRIDSLQGTDRAIANAMPRNHHSCRVWTCREKVFATDMIFHLEQHHASDLEAHAAELLANDLQVVCGQSGHNGMSTGDVSMIPKVEIRCPLCKTRSTSSEEFKDHMLETHLIAPDQSAHFESWRDYAKSSGFSSNVGTLSPAYIWHRKENGTVKCPACSWSQYLAEGQLSVHHFSMWGNCEELRPFRRHIMWLYPDFAPGGKYTTFEKCWAPVWSDLTKTERQKDTTSAIPAAFH